MHVIRKTSKLGKEELYAQTCNQLYCKSAFTKLPHSFEINFEFKPRDALGSGPAAAEVQHKLLSYGSQVNLAEGLEMGPSLSWSSPARCTTPSQGLEA